jgi:hypothetical protein
MAQAGGCDGKAHRRGKGALAITDTPLAASWPTEIDGTSHGKVSTTRRGSPPLSVPLRHCPLARRR